MRRLAAAVVILIALALSCENAEPPPLGDACGPGQPMCKAQFVCTLDSDGVYRCRAPPWDASPDSMPPPDARPVDALTVVP